MYLVAIVPAFIGQVSKSFVPKKASCYSLSSLVAKHPFYVSQGLEGEVILAPSTPSAGDAKLVGIALHAEVELIQGRWKIIRSPSTRNRLAKQDAERIMRFIPRTASSSGSSASEGVLEAYANAQKNQSVMDRRVDRAVRAAFEATPAGHLLQAVLGSMPVSAWAHALPGQVTVFSNHPKGLEESLPPIDRHLNAYLESQRRFAEWSQTVGSQKLPSSATWLLPKRAPRSGDHTILVTVRRERGRPEFQLAVFDDRNVLESEAVLSAGVIPDGTEVARVPHLGVVELSSETVRRSYASIPGKTGFDPEMLDVEIHEPLDAFVTESLQRYGFAKGFSQVIACVPDDLFREVGGCISNSNLDLDELARRLKSADLEEIPSGDCLVIRPISPLQQEATRLDRRPLRAEYLSASKGLFGIDSLLSLHAALARTYTSSSLLAILQSRIGRYFNMTKMVGWDVPHSVLAFLGELSQNERKQALSQGVVNVDLSTRLHSGFGLAEYLRSVTIAPVESAGSDPRRSDPAVRLADDLSRWPTRSLLDARGIQLSLRGKQETLVKRVRKGNSEISYVNPSTGLRTTKSGSNLLVDDDFVSIENTETFRLFGPRVERVYSALDASFLFYWRQNNILSPTIKLGAMESGPFRLGESIAESKVAVPLSDVPGIDYHP